MKQVRFWILNLGIAVLLFFLNSGCKDLPEKKYENIEIAGCQAISCHSTYPPASGIHTTHLNSTRQTMNCDSCHLNYTSLSTHQNQSFDGYDAKAQAQTSGDIVIFGTPDNPDATWDNSAGACNNINCHKHNKTVNWYSGCGTCHSAASDTTKGCTLGCHSVYPPASGTHTRHLVSIVQQMNCDTCHDNYVTTISHGNGIKEGYDANSQTQQSGDIVFFNTVANPNITWTNSTNTCGLINCHKYETHSDLDNSTLNWYTGCSTGTCHEFK